MEKYDIINDEKTLGFKKELITGVLGDQYYSDKYTVYMLENHPLFNTTEKKDRVGGTVLSEELLDSTSWIGKGVDCSGLVTKLVNSVVLNTDPKGGLTMIGRNVKLTNCHIESLGKYSALKKSVMENVKLISSSGNVQIKKSKILGGCFISTDFEDLNLSDCEIVSCNVVLHGCYLSLKQMSLWNKNIVESGRYLTIEIMEDGL